MTTGVNSGPIRHTIGRDGDLQLRTVSGTVRLRGTDGEEAVVVARHSSSGEEPELIVRRYQRGLSIEPQRRGSNFFGATIGIGVPDIDFEIEVPRGARLEISSVSADVTGEGLRGEQNYKLVSGDLDLEDAGGRLTAKSVSGDMRVHARAAIELDAVTTSGDLELNGERLDEVRIRSVSGDATVIGGLSDGPEHRVETVSGDLRLEPTTGVTIRASGPIIGLTSDIFGKLSSRPGQRELVIGDGSANLRFRSMSGQLHVSESPSVSAARTRHAAEDHRPAERREAAAVSTPTADDQLEILRALERGEIDVEEATRRLSGEASHA